MPTLRTTRDGGPNSSATRRKTFRNLLTISRIADVAANEIAMRLACDAFPRHRGDARACFGKACNEGIAQSGTRSHNDGDVTRAHVQPPMF